MDQELIEGLGEILADQPEVRVAYLFGSRARGDEAPDSDLDVAISVTDSLTFARRDQLSACLAAVVDANTVDLVVLEDAPPELAFRVIDEGRLLWAATEYERVELEADIASRYGDYRPVLRRQRRAIVEGGHRERAVQRYRKALGKTRRLLEQIGAAGGERRN